MCNRRPRGPGRHKAFDGPPKSSAVRLLLGLALLVLVAPGLSGCLKHSGPAPAAGPDAPANAPSPAIYTIKAPEEVWVTSSSDGIRLNSAVYRPDTTEPVPVYINFSPYWDDSAMKEGDAFAHYMIHEYVARGFAVVLTAVRGTGHSEGCFEVGSDREVKDLNDVVAYFAKQPWSNGNVAAGAKSYDGTSQNGMIAKFPSPALKGIFAVEGITNMYRYTFQDGVPARADAALFTEQYSAGQGMGEYAGGAAGAGDPTDESPESLMRLTGRAGCTGTADNVANPGASMASGIMTPYWVERDWTRSIAASPWNGSIFLVHGFQDWNVQPSHILPWLDEVAKNGHIEVFAWLHQWQQGGTGHVYPMRTDWNATMLRWLDHILKGKDNGWHGGFESDGSDGTWRASPAWPAVPGSMVTNVTAANGVLPFKPGTRITGAPVLRIAATPMTPDPVLHATWYDVDAGGKRTWVGEAVLRGDLTPDLTATRTIVPGTQMDWQLTFYPMDEELLPDHHWLITYGGTSSEGSNVGLVITPAQDQVTYNQGTMSLAAHVSHAELGAVAPQPEKMKCFTC